ncbi:uncharacterized protein LOC100899645 [Galendromus occidentalis]|uniref:Uncharacterized protein LOC100899645 n=1 Tax=Galendromus occidentalis TaxID=34638 RepID=A0AAJ6QRU0_9ACAR|nr:uncharacterized protein LOC100899645 [Galendromus occidentalis]
MRRKRAVVLTLVTFVLWKLAVYFSAHFPCRKAALSDLCAEWSDGDEVEGDWCFNLCNAVKSCHGVPHFGKELVVGISGPFGEAVAKGRHADYRDSVDSELRLDPTNPTKDFQKRMALRLSDFQKTNQFNLLITDGLEPDTSSNSQRLHFLQMMNQREFVWSFLYSQSGDASPFPLLRGTCGHVYIVEKSQRELNFVNELPIREKLKALVKVADLIVMLDEMNVEVCDFKWEHFGLFYKENSNPSESNEDFVVKLLDLDAVFSRHSLGVTMGNYHCTTDEDCDFFDCKGRCIKGDGLRKSTCVPSTVDSNIKRFLKMVSPSFFPPRRSLFWNVDDPDMLNYIHQCSSSECEPRQLRHLLQTTIGKLDPS